MNFLKRSLESLRKILSNILYRSHVSESVVDLGKVKSLKMAALNGVQHFIIDTNSGARIISNELYRSSSLGSILHLDYKTVIKENIITGNKRVQSRKIVGVIVLSGKGQSYVVDKAMEVSPEHLRGQ